MHRLCIGRLCIGRFCIWSRANLEPVEKFVSCSWMDRWVARLILECCVFFRCEHAGSFSSIILVVQSFFKALVHREPRIRARLNLVARATFGLPLRCERQLRQPNLRLSRRYILATLQDQVSYEGPVTQDPGLAVSVHWFFFCPTFWVFYPFWSHRETQSSHTQFVRQRHRVKWV